VGDTVPFQVGQSNVWRLGWRPPLRPFSCAACFFLLFDCPPRLPRVTAFLFFIRGQVKDASQCCSHRI
jgi:hypothetical protein